MTSETIGIKAEAPETSQQVCRLCLSENQLQSIFMKSIVQRWIFNYLSITVSEMDSISQSICTDCQTRLEEFHAFKQRCLEAQDVLEGKSPTEIRRNKLKCEFCAKVFPVKQQLINHGKSHVSKKFKCKICGKAFPHASRVARHIMEVHNKTLTSDKSTTRSIDKPDKPKTILEQSKHVPKHDPLQCDSDFKTTPTNDEQEEQTDRMVKCDLCDKKFKLKKRLKDHLRNVHLPKRYKCSICSKTFTTNARLNQHYNTHAGFVPIGDGSNYLDPEEAETSANLDTGKKQTNIRREPCSMCSRLIKVVSMDGHLNKHKGIKPYECKMGCPEVKFHCKLERISHYHDVHGWRAYECTICHQYFQTARSCRWHQIKAHGKGHKCTECHLIFETSTGLRNHIAKTNHAHTEANTDNSQPEEQQLMQTEDLFEAEDIKVECRSDEDGEMT